MRKIQSDCLFPISENPIPKGILIVTDDGIIQDVINPNIIDYNISDVQYYNGIICPGFVNTHCHLELSYLKSKIDKNAGINNFVIQIQKLKKSCVHEMIIDSAYALDKLMFTHGVVAIADIANTTDTLETKSHSSIYYHNFVELIGSDPAYADIIFDKGLKILKDFDLNAPQHKSSLTIHSLYAVSEKLLNKITAHTQRNNDIFSFHHLEGLEEKDFFLNKTGSIPDRLKYFNVDISSFEPLGITPLETLGNALPINSNTLLVHNIYALQFDITFALKKLKNVYWCLCPNSNLYIEDKMPDINLMINNKCKLSIGTDSLASNTSLNILDELKTLQKEFNVNTHDLLRMATHNGAEFMKIDAAFGSFSKNKKPGIVLVKNINPGNYYLTDTSESVRIL